MDDQWIVPFDEALDQQGNGGTNELNGAVDVLIGDLSDEFAKLLDDDDSKGGSGLNEGEKKGFGELGNPRIHVEGLIDEELDHLYRSVVEGRYAGDGGDNFVKYIDQCKFLLVQYVR